MHSLKRILECIIGYLDGTVCYVPLSSAQVEGVRCVEQIWILLKKNHIILYWSVQ